MYRLWAGLFGIMIIAALLTGCSNSGNSSSSLSGTDPVSALIVHLTASQTTIIPGQSVTLTWTSTNATSVVSSSWLPTPTALNGSVTLFPPATTRYSITVGGAKGTATSTLVVTVMTPFTAISSFGGIASYTPNTGFPVQITVAPSINTHSYSVQDILPAGWSAMTIDNNGSFNAVSNQVNWGPFTSATPIVLSYIAVPPSNASGSVSFSGTAIFDGTAVAISGVRTLSD